MSPPRPSVDGRVVPTATYRIQLRDGLTLDGVAEDGWLDHARSLGASHLYLSPVLAATPGSTHGYDVVDPTRVDPAIGGDDAFRRLAHAARSRGMGLVVDIVPNHMALDPVNDRWWRDVLRHGPASRWARMFDIDWDHPERRIRGSVLLPVLPDHYGRVLESGGLVLDRTGHEVVVRHGDLELPLEPSTTAPIVAAAAEALDDDVLRLVARDLARTVDLDAEARATEVDALDELLAERLDGSAALGGAIAAALADVTADIEALDQLLGQQHYRLANWKAASHDLGYRRFFDINGLIGVRVDRPEVFDLTHQAVRTWIEEDLVDGLRVDHPDGLARPGGYFSRLSDLSGGRWTVAEKILEADERLPEWAVDGTTGYDVAELVARLFLDERGLGRMSEVRDELVGAAPTIEELVHDCKLEVLRDVLAADLNRVTDVFLQLCETQRRLRDVTRHELHEVLREAAAALDVYRTYSAEGPPSAADLDVLARMLGDVRTRRPDLDPEVVDLLGAVLCRAPLAGDAAVVDPLAERLRTRVEQLSGPTMAKGKEDTAWYRDVRLIARNEVGARPEAGPLDASAFHEHMSALAARWPATMTGLSTHDSKRSEDVRARAAALTGRADRWAEVVRGWFRRHDHLVGDHGPRPATRMWIYQTLVTAHPLTVERLHEHLVKVLREGKVDSSWLRPDDAVESAVLDHATAVLADTVFLHEVADLVAELGPDADAISLGQKLVQLMAPGVPDLYWGSEVELLRLVDPDNRVPPDLGALRASLSGPVGDDLSSRKARLVQAALRVRARHAGALVQPRSYEPLHAEGVDGVLAFVRPGAAVVVAATGACPTLPAGAGLTLPPGAWRPVVGAVGSGPHRGHVSLGDLAGDQPVALLEPA
ncbi:malto-oligosyltrehalose synthase [Dermatobacter hominis]|uniref:malto-oligosyltrehalose synthase n=1 Tax=Dermatobacter hominis TaxID=2884263 RepID=UPI001D119B07|nr:malto-oligosyltrehalose synthase [Dermatobacter hominis]UDY37487.1 malto-oligosyltrehalose synthase [Dermatobacter hominis]